MSGPSAAASRSRMSRPMRWRSTSTSGSLPSSALVTAPANSGSSATNSAMCRSTSMTRAAGSSRFVRRRRGRGQPAPEHLGDQVFLGGEVGVGGGRADTGLGGDSPHGQTGESFAAQEVDRGPAQAIDGVGLLGGQTAPSRLQHRIGHVSGRYYNCRFTSNGKLDADERTDTALPAAAARSSPSPSRSRASCPPTKAARSTTPPSGISATASASKSARTAASPRCCSARPRSRPAA